MFNQKVGSKVIPKTGLGLIGFKSHLENNYRLGN